MHQFAETAMCETREACIELTKKCVKGICQQSDKQAMLDDNMAIFRSPSSFEFQPHKGDEVCTVTIAAAGNYTSHTTITNTTNTTTTSITSTT